MFHKIKFINICPLCLGIVVLFSNYHLVVVCLGGNYSVKDLGAYCLGCTVWWKKLVDNWLGIFLGVRFGLDLYCWLWEIKMFVWALFGVKKRVICRSLMIEKSTFSIFRGDNLSSHLFSLVQVTHKNRNYMKELDRLKRQNRKKTLGYLFR